MRWSQTEAGQEMEGTSTVQKVQRVDLSHLFHLN